MRDHLTFFRQFRQQFKTTGAIAPSSRFLANAMTRPLARLKSPRRVLEVGPGTGAVTRRIVRLLESTDVFDLVELNDAFVKLLKSRFEQHPDYQRVADISEIHACPLQEFTATEPYDVIISGLPLNNFSPDLVREIFAAFRKLLKPGGTLSYFEYMYVRPIRRRLVGKVERQRLTDLDSILKPQLKEHGVKRDSVLLNVPPAWVQHLQFGEAEAAS